ncbi:hypothetical protein SMAC4_04399 [Sordaria macrospora]|uniref:uncharacterized protein n=1 Tax=Sordaria macrospora TaxID=5147 RepID=UPI002B325BB5|nr:hypothetical protein SMAC4_04399 [Sordaria macrospora]
MVTQTDGNPQEKGVSSLVANHDAEAYVQPIEADESNKPAAVPPSGLWGHLCYYGHKVIVAGRVELQGISPIPVKERTVTKTLNIFTLWWSMSCNILPITFGMLGPVYGLSLRDSCLIILFFTLLSTILPAYLCTLGPKLGMRQMIQARYSWGRYIVSLPVLLNLATTTGFSVIIVITGGQCLSAVANGHLSISVGIVIMSILTLIISFCGYTTLHMYERFAWIPAVIAIIVAVGCGGKYLHLQNPPPSPPEPTGCPELRHARIKLHDPLGLPLLRFHNLPRPLHPILEDLCLQLHRPRPPHHLAHVLGISHRRRHPLRSRMERSLRANARRRRLASYACSRRRVWSVPSRHFIVYPARQPRSYFLLHHAQLPNVSPRTIQSPPLPIRYHFSCHLDTRGHQSQCGFLRQLGEFRQLDRVLVLCILGGRDG